MKMNHRLWSQLPDELLELSLSFLPPVDLCRFRVVCRRWNDLICSPEFGKLCVVNAARNANERAYFVVNRKVEHRSSSIETSRWSVLDLGAKKWYDLKPDLPVCSRLLDMDGGFVCTFVGRFSRPLGRKLCEWVNYTPKSLIMFNPFGGAVKVLPVPPLRNDYLLRDDVDNSTLKLIVDKNSDTFKVFIVMDGRRRGRRFQFWIYESSVDQWTIAPMPRFMHGHEEQRLSRVFFQGLLYCCFAYCRRSDGMLWSFNFLDHSWKDEGVRFPNVGTTCCPIETRCELAVIDNRLFLAKIFNEHGSCMLVDISEILLAEKRTRTVTRKNLSMVFPAGLIDVFGVRAFGFNKSKLLFCTKTGQVVMYNLATDYWEWLPQNPLDDSFLVQEADAGRMDYFRMQNTPW